MSHTVVIGLDLGTGTFKAVAMDGGGRVVAVGSAAVETLRPDDQRHEQAPDRLIEAARSALGECCDRLPPGAPVAGIVLSGAMHSLLAYDQHRQLLGDATIWSDQRAELDLAATLDRECGPDTAAALQATTGCPVRPLYHPARLRRRRRTEPTWFASARRFASITDLIAADLTGQPIDRIATCPALAAATGLLDTRVGRWHGPALAASGIDATRLPAIASGPGQSVGRVHDADGALPSAIVGAPIAAGFSDGAAANLGVGAHRGELVITLGTSAAVRRIADRPIVDPARPAWCYRIDDGRWLIGGAMNNGGSILDHLRRRYLPDAPPEAGIAQLLRDAAQAPPTPPNRLFIPLFAPERGTPWPNALRPGPPPADWSTGATVRAAIEGHTLCLWAIARMIGADDASPIRLCGGAARSQIWSQIIADVFDRPVWAMTAADASAIGAAAAGLEWWLDVKPHTVADQLHWRRYNASPAHRQRCAELRAAFTHWADQHDLPR